MADGIALLRHSFRFEAASGIGELARAVNRGDADEAVACLRNGQGGDLVWQPPDCSEAIVGLMHAAADAYAGYVECADVVDALAAFNRFRVLCALREGPFGVQTVNQALETELARRGLIDTGKPFYPGRPIMVTRNDYALKLFNGDVGLVWPDPDASHALRAFFPLPDGTLKGHAVSRLPPHESVFAMTVHKAQGSEFRRVLLLLPVEPSPVVTRELFYTGITRAMEGVTVGATEATVRRSLVQRSRRQTGLRDRLWGLEGRGEVAT
jgi:exodeoxyribonuclease V alpha subunit